MPESYGRPLCSSPRFRCETSHAAPIVRNTNDTPAKANPTTYQMPVNRTPFERRAKGRRRLPEDPPLSAQTYPERASGPVGILAVGTGRAADGGSVRRSVGERPAPSARAGSRAAPRQVVPDRGESSPGAGERGNRYIALLGNLRRNRTDATAATSVYATDLPRSEDPWLGRDDGKSEG